MATGRTHPVRRFKDRVFVILTFSATVVGVVLLAVLLWSILTRGTGRLGLDFLTSFPSRFADKAGIKSALYGSLWVMVMTALIAVPVGVAAAIFLEELNFRKNRLTEFVQLNISNLAGVPSIVYGLLGLAVFVRFADLGRSIIAGALTMTLLILPMLITVAQEALRAVPRSFREASYALGATQWQTIRRQVLPAALPGILTGVILSLSRAMGETAPLIMIGAVSYIAFVPTGPSDNFTVLPLQIFSWSSMPQQGYHEAAAAAIIVLLAALLGLNALAIIIRARAMRRFRG
jgi:phosphate transport system permease protein